MHINIKQAISDYFYFTKIEWYLLYNQLNISIFVGVLTFWSLFDNEAKTTREKNFVLKFKSNYLDSWSLNTLIYSLYNDAFLVYRKSSTQVATEYLSGLLQCEKDMRIWNEWLKK